MKSKGTFRRLFSYLRPHRLRLTLVFFMGILATLFTVVAPSVLGGITTQLYNGVSTGVFDWDMILILLAALVVLYLVSQAFAYVQSVGMNRVMTLSLLYATSKPHICGDEPSSKATSCPSSW